MFTLSNGIPEGEKELTQTRAELFINSYNKQKVAGYGLGDRDVSAFGIDGLKTLAAKAQFPFLCSNLVDMEGKPVFVPHVVVAAAGYRIGVFSILTGGAEVAEKDKYKVLPSIEAARVEVAALDKEGVDAVVMLAHMDKGDTENLAREVPGIDLFLGGQSMGSSQVLEPLGTGFWAEAGQKGKFLNIIVLNLTTPGHKQFVLREEADKLRKELAELDDRIKRYSKLQGVQGAPGTRTADPARFKGVVDTMLKRREGLAQKAAGLTKVKDDAPFLSFESVAMSKTLRDDTETAKWIEEFEKKYPQAASGGHGGHATAPARLAPGMKADAMRKVRPLVAPTTGGTTTKP